MKSMMIQMLKARDVPTFIALVRAEDMVWTSLFQAKAVLLSLLFFKKIQIDDEIKMNF